MEHDDVGAEGGLAEDRPDRFRPPHKMHRGRFGQLLLEIMGTAKNPPGFVTGKVEDLDHSFRSSWLEWKNRRPTSTRGKPQTTSGLACGSARRQDGRNPAPPCPFPRRSAGKG